MRFSVIVATLHRTEENRRLLQSIADQEYNDLEIIFADQNADDRLIPILAGFQSFFPIVHLRSGKGLSRARNRALAVARGEIICFPDDDCWYPPGLLKEVDRLFRDNPTVAGFTGRCTDEHGRLSAGSASRLPGLLDRYTAWSRGVSATMFLRTGVFKKVGEFDEGLGLGSYTPFQSGEETDLLLRAVANGFPIQYLPSIVVFHPLESKNASISIERAWSYGAGMGRVLRKHGEGYLRSWLHILVPIAGAMAALLHCDWRLAQIRIARALGRFHGWNTPFEETTVFPWLASKARSCKADD